MPLQRRGILVALMVCSFYLCVSGTCHVSSRWRRQEACRAPYRTAESTAKCLFHPLLNFFLGSLSPPKEKIALAFSAPTPNNGCHFWGSYPQPAWVTAKSWQWCTFLLLHCVSLAAACPTPLEA